MFSSHWGIELLAATPFSHDVKLKGTSVNAANGKLGSLKQLPPTLSVVYYPLGQRLEVPTVCGCRYQLHLDL